MKPRSRHAAERDGYELGQSFGRRGIACQQARDPVRDTLPRFIGAVWESHASEITVADGAGYDGR